MKERYIYTVLHTNTVKATDTVFVDGTSDGKTCAFQLRINFP